MPRINDPEIVSELASLHERYEAALVGNDVSTLTSLFWDSTYALRFGAAESLYGAEEIEAFRNARSPVGLAREVFNLRIVAFGGECGTVTLEFRRTADGRTRHGRQSQLWIKFAEGWKIVSAHVSLVPDSYVDHAAAYVGMPIPPEFRAGVMQNLERSASIVAPLLAFAMEEQIEAAPVFVP
jgi:Protein of unknown function (DUF3225)/Protein of unknown function (DUF4089)